MPRMDKLSSYKTTIAANESGDVVVTYQSTPIVTFNDKRVTLKSGGWQTVTTKRKMNQSACQFNLGYSVTQRNYEWFVTLPNGSEAPFTDGMTFERVAA